MEERKILNGSLMRKYHSVPAQMFVNIPKTLPGGSKINGTTTDKQNITLEMQSPTTQSLQGWIEVFGKAKSNDVFLCQDVVCFKNDENELPFDMDAHNAVCIILDNIPNEILMCCSKSY